MIMKELKGTKTEKNLMEAFAGESMARNKYTYFASRAKKDGFEQIAAIFEETAANEKAKMRGVAAIEKLHEERYRKLLKNIEDALVFSREGDAIWVCRNCGHVVVGKQAPQVCPVCNHPQSYFELKAENY